ncbi:hypothetical protein WOLCODRAFT_136982 [Wolfiporia cocos MD-104 SS10]|uniref:RRM domain-containing protein n=1 Tax=Wolfiporia cocos (strain MD-104) TaxID=742152 RepID=A0A2H3JFT9_WOLCO|nr:hypothetical protein WOLCODRAFT_136982 [Wolfiporia cocos MD-104 SS10]
MSIGSPTAPYQFQQQAPRADSPSNDTVLPSHIKSPQHSTDPFSAGPQNSNSNHPMYNSMNSSQFPSDYTPLASAESDALNFHSKANGFGSPPFRTSTSFNPFPSRSRQNTVPFRETSSSFNNASYPLNSTDLYNGQGTQAQTTSSFGFDGIHHPSRAQDFSGMGAQAALAFAGNGVSQNKAMSFPAEAYRTIDPGIVSPQGMATTPLPLHQAGGQQPFGMAHTLTHPHQTALSAQTQFGSTLPTAASGPGMGGQGSSLAGAPSMTHGNGTAPTQQQEEISTIFVVGFPDDMQEREFQNMFTFSPGFEAATLKIPTKDNTAYGFAGAPTGSNARLQYPGSNDPYNIVTVNQGGVVVDGGRDGPTTSWPAVAPDESHFVHNNIPVQPPRKQIIGFAKFRTRKEALEARDILQGRRVDIEKGSVLKAEMAKKNLHTKRGPNVPGMPPLVSGGAGSLPETLPHYSALNGFAGLSNVGASEPFTQRERELGTIGAMGIGIQRRERMVNPSEDEARRMDMPLTGSMGLSVIGPRGARERAEEDERERKRKEEKEVMRLRQNSYAFEAFHSVPQQMVRQGTNSVLSAENGAFSNGAMSPPAIQSVSSQDSNGPATSPWGNLRDIGHSAVYRKMSMPILSSTLPQRPTSPPLQSPPATSFDPMTAMSSAPLSASSQNGNALLGNRSAPFSPQSNSSSLPSHPSLPTRPRPFSPSTEQQPAQPAGSSQPNSSASSASGSQSGHEEELSRSVAALAVNTDQGTTSPQLPSPASGSSGTGRNPGDQNPPINTLYVGNLPSSPGAGGLPLNHLEDRLRELFSKRPGYRKLCFRQKSNGPMCFVEFEDVNYATQALRELYGNTLGGLVKGGGIRLSYSKNPLGVRTPTSGGNGHSLQLQQALTFGQSLNEAFATRLNDPDVGRIGRRDTSGMTSPTSSYYHPTSPPPPRFISPPPSGPFTSSIASPTAFSRTSSQGFGLAANGTGSFSPFGISPSHSTIPDQPTADANNDPVAHSLTSITPNIEASRAG